MSFPCHATNMPFTAGSRHADGMRTAWELNVSDLPAVGIFLLTRGVPGSLLSEAGEWQGRGMVCVNRALTRQGNGMVCVNPPEEARCDAAEHSLLKRGASSTVYIVAITRH